MNATEIYLDNNSFDAQIEFTHAVRSILEKSGGRTLYNVGYVKFDSVIVRLSDHAPSYIRIENDIDNDLCTRFIDARIGFASSNRDAESEREDFLASYPNCLTELEAEKHYESAQAFALRILECIAS